MGAVYKACRADGEVHQVVAIKVLEHAWLSPRTVDRFRRERQILSGLAHPNISRLLDTGTREDGRPYLVMEYIEGEPLDAYCRKHQLSIPQRLRLFLPICHAVEYAHSKLVIHRDLKPSNILVTAAGEPKLLDFGIADALDEPRHPATHTLLFTPSYGSPEQARNEPAATSMDVYGLGAVLYDLLTGAAPHRVEGLAPGEIVRHLCEQEPPPPSSVCPELKGDLENIVRKAMRIEPERRYHTVRELSADVENYLALRPVVATPDTFRYRAGRFVARRRWPLIAAGIAITAVAVGAFSTWTERRRTEEQAAISKAVQEFLQNDLISQAGLRSQIERGEKPDPDLKVRTLLDRAALSVPRKFRGLPRVEAAIRIVIGDAYRDLGLDEEACKHYQQAVALRRSALGQAAPETLEAANRLGDALASSGKPREAEAVFRDTIALAGSSQPAQRAAVHARFSQAMMAAAAKRQGALDLLRTSIEEMRVLEGPSDANVLAGLNQLAVLQLEAGNAAQAQGLFREILDTRTKRLGAAHPDTLASMSELGMFYFLRSRHAEAEEFLQRSAEGMEAVLGPSHPVTLSTLNNLTILYTRQGRYPQSEMLRRRILEGEQKLRGPEHPDTLAAAHNLASACQLNGKYAEAAKLYEQTLAIKRRTLGPEHPLTLSAMRGLAAALRESGRPAESVQLASAALTISKQAMGVHLDTAASMNELARAQKALGNAAAAERNFRDALEIRQKLLGPGNQTTLVTKNDLAGLLQSAGRLTEAESMLREILATRRRLLGEEHPSTLNTMSDLAALYRKQHKLADAANLQRSVVDSRRKSLDPNHPNTLRAMRDLAAIYRDQSRCAEASSLLASVLEPVDAKAAKGETLLGLNPADLRRERKSCRENIPMALNR